MDISVSQLNGRLAAKLPPELPLGLVFVTGQVKEVMGDSFVLKEGTHELPCRANGDTMPSAGDEVRASGHLMFDAEQLRYFLLARDIEIITSEPLDDLAVNSRELLAEGEDLLAALAVVKARAAVAPDDTAEMPPWVKKLAPKEVQAETPDDVAQPTSENVALDDGLVTMLSAAMDSEEELELTPELLAPYQVTVPETAVQPDQSSREDRLMDTAVPTNPTSYQPANREDTDWLVILLIISFFVLTIAVIVTIVLLIL
ncbi:exodeoxyribonuclease VII large subunit [Candidatus Leptofilum sp.]|uniref:exodeoxyribonuclease VII large subunit n=1 Tax=Candidatus Leptofilum sp. TaxID=3241576 RepID=UPI003B5B80AF